MGFEKKFRQYHQEKVKSGTSETTQVTQDYTLGAWWEPSPAAKTADAADAAGAAAATNADAPSAKVQGGGGGEELREDAKTRKKYWRQLYGNGTHCDVTGKPRETEVRLQCSSGEPSHLSSIEEVATCQYVVHFSTSLLCKHPSFAAEEGRDETQTIQCEPLGPDGLPIPAPKKRAAAEPQPAAAAASAAAAAARPAKRGDGSAPSALQAARDARRAAGGGVGAGATQPKAKTVTSTPPERKFALGTCLMHLKFNYRGIVVGYDERCEQSEVCMRPRQSPTQALTRPEVQMQANRCFTHQHPSTNLPPKTILSPTLDAGVDTLEPHRLDVAAWAEATILPRAP